MPRMSTSTERKSYRSVRSDHVRRRRWRERVHERLHDLQRRGQEHHGSGGGELLPQRVPHPPRGGGGPEEAWHAVPGGGRRGRARRRGGGGRRPRPRGTAEGAGLDPGVAEPRERARAEEAVRAAAARELLALGAARRGAEASVHGWLASADGRIGREIGIERGFGETGGGF
jgi:hypothetical protein